MPVDAGRAPRFDLDMSQPVPVDLEPDLQDTYFDPALSALLAVAGPIAAAFPGWTPVQIARHAHAIVDACLTELDAAADALGDQDGSPDAIGGV